MRIRKTTIVIIILGVILIARAVIINKQVEYITRIGFFDRRGAVTRPQVANWISLQPLFKQLKDKDERVRKGAIAILQELKDPRSILPLIEVLKNKNETDAIRYAASRALSSFPDPRAARAIEEFDNDYSDYYESRKEKRRIRN